MSINDPNVKELVLSQFRGSIPRSPAMRLAGDTSDAYNVDGAHLLNAQNLDFSVAENGMVQAGTRTGTTTISGTAGVVGQMLSMASWVFVTGGVETAYVVFLGAASGNIFAWKQNTNSLSGILVAGLAGGISACFAFEGLRMYVAFQTNVIAGPGNASAWVYSIATGATDPLFLFGLTFATAGIASSTVGAGNVTGGVHRIGYIFTTNNGYTSPLNPVVTIGQNPNAWNYSVYNNATGTGQSINVTITWNVNPLTLIPSGATVQIIMTPANNPNTVYTVPGATATMPSGGTTVINININDADLIATGTNVTQNQNQLAQNPGTGAPPFKPSAIFLYSARMGYCTYDSANVPVLYFSDQNNYQSLTAAFHGIYLEGRQVPIQGSSLGGVCYIATLSGLYAVQDNGGLPSTWVPAARVDGSVGVLSSSCMSAGTQEQGTATGRILLASEKGLFVFKGGTFPEIPLSYWQSTDWNRINWAAPWQVQVVDDVYRQKIRVLAPLISFVTNATNANPIVVTTGQPHLIQAGATGTGTATIQVTIAGVLGNTATNGTWTVTVINATSFSVPTAGNGAYQGSGIVTPSTQNGEMDWTYPEGDAPGQPFYSLNSWASYAPGAIGIIRNLATQIDETWYGPALSSGALQRRVSPSDLVQYSDQDSTGNAAAILSVLETSLTPNAQDTSRTLHDFHGAHLRISGTGFLSVTAFGLDHTLAVVPAASPLTLNLSPGQELLMKWFLRSEQQSIQFATSIAGQSFLLARIKAYYTDSVPMR